MSGIKTFLALEDKMTPTLSKAEKQAIANMKAYKDLDKEVKNLEKEMASLEKAGFGDTKTFDNLWQVWDKARYSQKEYINGVKNAKIELDDLGNSGESAFGKIGRAMTAIGATALLAKGASYLANLYDTSSSTLARLGMIENSEMDIVSLNREIYKSAQDARVSYQATADTVASLGNQARDAFGDTKEIVDFSNLLNKTFTASGLDSNAISSVMYNLTQSLSTGKLLGQDYRILKQNAPQLIKYLEKFYGTNRAGLDEMVSQGKVTAQDIKAAMFGAADDINEKFEAMPMTFEQAWTKIQNSMQVLLQPLAQIFGKIAEAVDQASTYLLEHREVLYVVAGAIMVVTGAMIAYATATAIAGLIEAGVFWPVTIAALALVAAIALLIWQMQSWAKIFSQLTGTTISTTQMIMIYFNMLGVAVHNVFVHLHNVVATFVNFFANAFVHPIETVEILFLDLQTMAIGVLQNIAEVMDKIFGSNLSSAVGGYISGLKSKRDKIIAESGYAEKMELMNYESFLPAIQKGMTQGAEVDKFFDDISDKFKLGDMSDTFSNINDLIGTDGAGGKALKTTSNDKLLTDEDIQLLLDVATRDYKLTYQQVTPNITVTFGDIRETADVDDVLDKLADRLEEIADSNLEVATI